MDTYASRASARSWFRNPLETSGLLIIFKTRSIRKTSSHQHAPGNPADMTDPGAFVPIGSENDRRRLSHHGNPTRASRTSASGWHGHQPVTVVPDFHRLLTASGNNVEAAPWDKRRAYAEEWRGFTPRSTCRSQAKPGHLVLIKDIFISYSYVHLISGDGIFPLCQSPGR